MSVPNNAIDSQQILSSQGTPTFNSLTINGGVLYGEFFELCSSQYSVGTFTQSGSTVTASSATFTQSMVGGLFICTSGSIFAPFYALITAVPSSTTLTIDTSLTISSPAHYKIYYNGVASDGTLVGISNPLYVSNNGINYTGGVKNIVSVPLTSSNITGMYATPVQLIASPGAGKVNFITYLAANYLFSTAFSAGGVIVFQYGNTAHGAGTVATGVASVSTNFLTGTADTLVTSPGPTVTPIATLSNYVNQGIFISNQTQAFAGGPSTVNVYIEYLTLNMS
jgi:hypothetical protein